MRKITLTVLLALFCAGLCAQEKNLNIGLAIGGYDRYQFGHSEIIDLHKSSTYNDISYVSNPKVLPTVSVEGGYIFPGNRVGAFLGAYWSYAYNYLTGGPSLLKESENIVHIVPQVRLYYLYTGNARLYATFGAGVRVRTFSETFEGDTITSGKAEFSYIISPFGMSFGDNWTFGCDFGSGKPWSLFNMTIGYRF